MKARRKPSSRAASTPRGDSLAFLSMSSSASATSPSSSSGGGVGFTSAPSSILKRKTKYRSSLESLPSTDVAVDGPSPGKSATLQEVVKRSTSKRPPNTMSVFLTPATTYTSSASDATTATPPPTVSASPSLVASNSTSSSLSQQQQQQQQQREMSAQSRSKLNSLVKRIHTPPPSADELSTKKKKTGGLAGKKNSIRGKKQEMERDEFVEDDEDEEVVNSPSKKKVAKKAHKEEEVEEVEETAHYEDDEEYDGIGESDSISISDYGSSSYRTPKTKRTNINSNHSSNSINNNSKQSIELCITPLPYRQDGSDVGTPMLENYCKQWAKAATPLNGQDGGGGDEESVGLKDDDEDSRRSREGGVFGEDRGNEYDGRSSDGTDDKEEEDTSKKGDEASSSVVSTSSYSGDDGEEGLNSKQPAKAKASKAPTSTVSPQLDKNNMLELEYGRLAFIKQELERKMKMHKDDAEKMKPLIVSREAVGTPHSFMSSDAASPSPSAATSSLRTSVTNIGLLTPTVAKRSGDDQRAQGSGGKSMASEASFEDDVKYGELVYQRTLAERRMAEMEDGVSDDLKSEYPTPPPKVRFGWKEYDDDGSREHDGQGEFRSRYFNEDFSCRSPVKNREPRGGNGHSARYNHRDDYLGGNDVDTRRIQVRTRSSPRKKKRKRRRVVETITRVVHEESEEEGSSSRSSLDERYARRDGGHRYEYYDPSERRRYADYGQSHRERRAEYDGRVDGGSRSVSDWDGSENDYHSSVYHRKQDFDSPMARKPRGPRYGNRSGNDCRPPRSKEKSPCSRGSKRGHSVSNHSSILESLS